MPTAVPIDPSKLIEAAHEFATHRGGRGRPRPIWLRRSVSTAYYALFHGLCRAAASHVLPNASAEDQLKAARLFQHSSMKATCAQIANRQGAKLNAHLNPLALRLRSTPVSGVASAFYDLQEARHRADYDHLEPFSKQATLAFVEDAKKALETLDTVDAGDREAFLALLAMSAR